MPKATTPEAKIPTDRPARDLGITWFKAKLAERLLQAGTMAKNAAMLRRGAFKMQDGTLGKEPDKPEEPDDMNIRVGDDTTHNHYAAPEPVTPPASKAAMTLGKVALVAALAGTGGAGAVAAVAVPWLLNALNKPPAVTAPETVAVDDQDTNYSVTRLR